MRRKVRGFTLVELIIVLLIVSMLSVMVVPLLSRINRGSKVQQAAQAVVSALYRARALAQKYRSTVAVFYGDDPSAYPPSRWRPPLSGTLPGYQQIEIWTVRTAEQWNLAYTDRGNGWVEDGMSATLATPHVPTTENLGNTEGWYPYWSKDELLTPQPISFPEGVRILAGNIYVHGPGPGDQFSKFDFGPGREYSSRDPLAGSYKPGDPTSAIKFHNSVYTKNGSCPTFNDYHCFLTLLIWDTTTGEHVVVQVGEHKSSSRPRILDQKLTHVNGVPLTNYRQINELVNW